MNPQNTIDHYLQEIASHSPTPGGGNVSAFCGTLASNLGVMVTNLTIGKKKYLAVEERMKQLQSELQIFANKFTELAQADNEAFDKVMIAMKLPKETDEEKKLRADSIQIATIKATSVPFTVIETSIGVIPLLMQTAEKGNTNSLSDVGVALLLAKTCANGAFLNVLINLSSLTDEQVRSEVEEKATNALNTINQSVDTFMEMLINRIKG